MTIKEAVERGPMRRERRLDFDNPDVVEGQCDEILEQSGANKLIDELAQMVGGYALAVLNSDGLKADVRWVRTVDSRHREESEISIMVRPASREIVIRGVESELLTEADWGNKEVLEDAFALAYLNPYKRITQVGSRIRLYASKN